MHVSIWKMKLRVFLFKTLRGKGRIVEKEQKFWITIWSLVLMGVLGIVFSITITTIHADYRVAQAISNGTEPIKAKYALKMTTTQEDALAWMAKTNEKD